MYSAKKRTLPGAALPSLINTVDRYHMVITNSVQIAELKSRLREYLRRVRRGETITVLPPTLWTKTDILDLLAQERGVL